MEIANLSLTPEHTQRFAEEVCFDYNSVHNANNTPQYISGDYLVLSYIDFLKKIPDSFSVSFGRKRGAVPNEILTFNSNGISTNDAQNVLKIENTTPLKFEGYSLDKPHSTIIRANSQIPSFFPEFDHKAIQFAGQYCLVSGDLWTGLLDQILENENFFKTSDTLLLYTSAAFELYSTFNRLKENENLERKIFDIKTNIRANGKSGKILVSYFLINSVTKNKVGVLQKDLACYNLTPKLL